MAKIKPAGAPRKLTADIYAEIANVLQEAHPQLAQTIRDGRASRLDTVLRTHGLYRIEQQTARYMESYLLPRDAFADMATVGRHTEREKKMGDAVATLPAIGTAEWVFEVFPDAKAHFCRLIIEADEAYRVLRDLTANYNFMGYDTEDIPPLLSFVNDFCNILRPLATIQEHRARAIAHGNRQRMHSVETTPNDKAA